MTDSTVGVRNGLEGRKPVRLRWPSHLSPAVLVAVVAMAACVGDDGAIDAEVVTYDSASVRVTVNRVPAAGADTWTVVLDPVLRIGGPGAEGPAALFRVSGLLQLAEGGVAVADASREIRVFGADGRLVARYGGAGEGPGEFQHISVLARLPGDSLLAIDGRTARSTVLAPDGTVARTITLPTDLPGATYAMDVDPAGSVYMLRGRGFGIDAEEGVHRPEFTIYRVSADGTEADSLGAWPGPRTHVRIEGRRVSVTETLLTDNTHIAPARNGFFVGTSDRYEIERRAMDGRLLQLVRVAGAEREVDDALADAALEARLARIGDDNLRRLSRRTLTELPPPERVPAFAGFIIDDSEHLWVRSYPLPGDTAQAFDVFDPAGRWKSSVQLPTDFTPWHIGEDFVLGVQRDELGVESVVRFRLERAEAN